jgi:hypothetical protein
VLTLPVLVRVKPLPASCERPPPLVSMTKVPALVMVFWIVVVELLTLVPSTLTVWPDAMFAARLMPLNRSNAPAPVPFTVSVPPVRTTSLPLAVVAVSVNALDPETLRAPLLTRVPDVSTKLAPVTESAPAGMDSPTLAGSVVKVPPLVMVLPWSSRPFGEPISMLPLLAMF